MASTTKIIYRTIIVLGCIAIGLMLGMFWAAKSGAADGSGLAGGAIVLGYGLIGTSIAAVTGLVIGLRLSDSKLQQAAGVLGIALLIIVAFVTMRVRSERLANLDPPEAYGGIPLICFLWRVRPRLICFHKYAPDCMNTFVHAQAIFAGDEFADRVD